MEYLHTLIYLCPLIFLAGFIDSAAGGGGTIAIPAYLLTGMPVHFALGTNKFSMTIGTSFAAARFIKSKAVDIKPAVISGLFAIAASYIGAKTAISLDERTITLALIFVLPCVALFIAFRKNKIQEGNPEKTSLLKKIILSALIGFFIGGYDGLIGPGTGTFAIIAYNTFMGYDFKTASGNAKILNLSSNLAAAVAFAIDGHIYFVIGIPAALCCIAGNYIGSGFAIKKGAKFIRPMLFVVLGILLIKIIYDFVGML